MSKTVLRDGLPMMQTLFVMSHLTHMYIPKRLSFHRRLAKRPEGFS